MKMRTGFNVDGEIVGSCFGKLRDEGIGIGDHQMNVKRQFRDFFQAFNDGWPDGQIRHEMAVHHIDMQEIGTRSLHCGDFVGQAREVRGQNRGCNMKSDDPLPLLP